MKKRGGSLVIILIVSIIVILILLFGVYFNFKYRLNLGANIKSILISEDGQKAYLKLEGGSINKNITKVKFIFYDKNEEEYYYETTEGAKEFSVFFKKSWLFFKKPSYEGRYNYEINADEIGLDSFNNIKRIEVFFEYETNSGDVIVTLPLDTEEPIYDEELINEYDEEGDGEETNFETCTDDTSCLDEGIFCLGNKVYNCEYENGCLDKTNEMQCESEEECINGSGCMKLIECTNNNNCNYLNNACSYGICNLNKCELRFNSSINICRRSSGECDLEEYCTGSSTSCPVNKFKDRGASCSLGVCNNNICVECLDDNDCQTGEVCENNNCVDDICYEVICSDYLSQNTCENSLCLSCEWNSSLGICKEPSLPLTNQLSQFGITWTFDKQYGYGQFANGDYWVTGPIKIISINPVSVDNETGRIVHGSMLNPSPKSGYQQGYDSKMYGVYDRGYYNSSLNVARPNGQQLSSINPLIIQEGSLVSSISTPDTTRSTQLQTAAILTVLKNPVPEGSFRPSYSGSDKTIRFNKNQLNYSLLKKLAPVANTPRLKQRAGDAQADSVERMFERPWLDHIPLYSGLGRSHHPKDNMIDYGREMSTQVGIASLMLNLNFSNQEKEALLIRFVQLGIDYYGVIQEGGRENWMGAGGQTSGHKFPILFAGLMLNDGNMRNIGSVSGDYLYSGNYGSGNEPPNYIYFGEDDQTFYVAQEDVDATHSTSWNPDSRDTEKIRYESEDIGLPEWGIIHANGPERSNKFWATAYRQVTGPGWGGWILAVHIMGVKDLWNHDALFDYQDRYMYVAQSQGWRTTNYFSENMWDTYRDDYGCVWTLYNPDDIYSQGSNGCEMPSVKPESLWDKIIGWFR